MLTGIVSITNPDYTPDRVHKLLERIGVQVKRWCPNSLEFHVEVDDEAMALLDDMWGPLVWTLTPKES